MGTSNQPMGEGMAESVRILANRDEDWLQPQRAHRLDRFEADHGVVLPAELRALYGATDGSTCCDAESWIRLWSVDEWEKGTEPVANHPELRLFYFADWGLNAWLYSVCLAGPEEMKGTVWIDYVAPGMDPKKITDSVAEFLDAMVRKDDVLFGPGDSPKASNDQDPSMSSISHEQAQASRPVRNPFERLDQHKHSVFLECLVASAAILVLGAWCVSDPRLWMNVLSYGCLSQFGISILARWLTNRPLSSAMLVLPVVSGYLVDALVGGFSAFRLLFTLNLLLVCYLGFKSQVQARCIS